MENERKQIAKISVFITSIFVIFLSVTYAFINQTLVGTKRQVITAGNLELELLEDENNLTIQDALPMYDEVGMLQEAFTFRLTNKTTMNTNYVLKLVDITTGEKLDTNIVKYGLTKDEVSNIKLLSNLNNNELDKGIINGKQTIEYSLRLWIDSGVEDNSLIREKSLSYKISVEVGQEVEKSVYAVMQKVSEDPYAEETYWEFKRQVTTIIFENKIDVPIMDIPEGALEFVWDVSEEQDESVMAYVEANGNLESGDVAYTLHFQGENGIYANPDSSYLFRDFSKLTTIEGLEYFNTENVTNMRGMFSGCSSLTSLDLRHFNTEKVTNMSIMFYECSKLTNLDLSSFDTANLINMSSMFYKCSSLTSLDVSNFNTVNVTDMSSMFDGCSGLTSLDVSHFDTANVTTMSYMFYGCSGLTSLDVSNFNTTNVTSMYSMFDRCSSLTSLDLSHFDTTNVTDMSSMFDGCSGLTSLDLSSFDTINVTKMYDMFQGCSSLTSLDLSHFDTTNVTTMSYMFYGCSGLTSLDLSSFSTSNVTSMSDMFDRCSGLTSLDLSSFDITNVKYMSSMFNLVKVDCLITVKDEATKTWILERNNALTNINIKGV